MTSKTARSVISFPPGPRSVVPGLVVGELRRGPLAFLTRLRKDYGDVAGFYAFGQKYVVVSHPDLAKEILLSQADAYWKGPVLQNSKGILGEGLLTAEGESHRQQRRMMQGSFHAKHVESYAGEIVRSTREVLDAWRRKCEMRNAECEKGEIEIRGEMMGLTLVIAGRTLFGTMLADEIETVRRCMDDLMGNYRRAVVPWGKLLNMLPLASTRRLAKAQKDMRDLVGRMIKARRAEGGGNDLLSKMLAATDSEEPAGGAQGENVKTPMEIGCPHVAGNGTAGKSDGTKVSARPVARMTDTQLRDQAITILTASHETTANAMTFTLYLLAKYPEEQRLLRDEVRRVLRGSEPTVEMIDRLERTRWVLSESMRLYPPAWTLGRQNRRVVEIGGYRLPAKCTVLIPQWTIHRDERFWENPAAFSPERWRNPKHPRYAYLPFSTGVRNCIGESFGWLEMIMALAMLVSEFEFALPAGTEKAELEVMPAITLRPKNPVPMVVRGT